MPSSGILHRVDLGRTDVSEEIRASLLVTVNVPSSTILVTLMMKALSSSETSALTGATLHNIPEYGILHSHRRENLKSYTVLIIFTCCKTSNLLNKKPISIGEQLRAAIAECHLILRM
jgi:hypothetical protein